MENKEIIKAVEAYQNAKVVHPLTCGNDSRHSNLVAEERTGQVVLVCLDCNYVQIFIPDCVLHCQDVIKKMEEDIERMQKAQRFSPYTTLLHYFEVMDKFMDRILKRQ